MGLGQLGESANGKSKLSAEGGAGSTQTPFEASILSYFLAYPRSPPSNTLCFVVFSWFVSLILRVYQTGWHPMDGVWLMNKVAPHLDSSLFLLNEGNYNGHFQLLNQYSIELGTTLITSLSKLPLETLLPSNIHILRYWIYGFNI